MHTSTARHDQQLSGDEVSLLRGQENRSARHLVG
jgi:hypothetical protein